MKKNGFQDAYDKATVPSEANKPPAIAPVNFKGSPEMNAAYDQQVQGLKAPPAAVKEGAPSWLGRPVLDPSHHGDLEQRAAINEFQHKMPRAQAEAKAHEEYVKDHRQRAAAHHLQGMRAAGALGNKDDAHKHWLLYDMHMKALGLESVGPVPPEVQKHTEAQGQKPLYRFKAHKGDVYALQDHKKSQEQEVQKSELSKAEPRFRAAFHHVPTQKVYIPKLPIHDFDDVAEQAGVSRDEMYGPNSPWVSGFVDKTGKFYNREEAAEIVAPGPWKGVKQLESTSYLEGVEEGTFKSEAKTCKWRLGERRCQRKVNDGYCHSHKDHWANKIKQKEAAEAPELEKATPKDIAFEKGKRPFKAGQKVYQTSHTGEKFQYTIANNDYQMMRWMDHDHPHVFIKPDGWKGSAGWYPLAALHFDEPTQKSEYDLPEVLEILAKTAKAALEKNLVPPPAPVKQGPALHGTVEGFVGALKTLPKGSPERGKFLTQHMNHAPFLAALQKHPQGKQVHAMLTQHLNSTANAGFKPGKVVATVKSELAKGDVIQFPGNKTPAQDQGKAASVTPIEDEGKAWVNAQAQQQAHRDGNKSALAALAGPAPTGPRRVVDTQSMGEYLASNHGNADLSDPAQVDAIADGISKHFGVHPLTAFNGINLHTRRHLGNNRDLGHVTVEMTKYLKAQEPGAKPSRIPGRRPKSPQK